jgi:hypothetical protein
VPAIQTNTEYPSTPLTREAKTQPEPSRKEGEHELTALFKEFKAEIANMLISRPVQPQQSTSTPALPPALVRGPEVIGLGSPTSYLPTTSSSAFKFPDSPMGKILVYGDDLVIRPPLNLPSGSLVTQPILLAGDLLKSKTDLRNDMGSIRYMPDFSAGSLLAKSAGITPMDWSGSRTDTHNSVFAGPSTPDLTGSYLGGLSGIKTLESLSGKTPDSLNLLPTLPRVKTSDYALGLGTALPATFVSDSSHSIRFQELSDPKTGIGTGDIFKSVNSATDSKLFVPSALSSSLVDYSKIISNATTPCSERVSLINASDILSRLGSGCYPYPSGSLLTPTLLAR